MNKDVFFTLLNHSWNSISETNDAQYFVIGIRTRNTIKDALISILYSKNGTVYVQLMLIGDKWDFPSWTIKSIVEDLKKIILQRGSYNIIEGDMSIGKDSDSFILHLDD